MAALLARGWRRRRRYGLRDADRPSAQRAPCRRSQVVRLTSWAVASTSPSSAVVARRRHRLRRLAGGLRRLLRQRVQTQPRRRVERWLARPRLGACCATRGGRTRRSDATPTGPTSTCSTRRPRAQRRRSLERRSDRCVSGCADKGFDAVEVDNCRHGHREFVRRRPGRRDRPVGGAVRAMTVADAAGQPWNGTYACWRYAAQKTGTSWPRAAGAGLQRRLRLRHRLLERRRASRPSSTDPSRNPTSRCHRVHLERCPPGRTLRLAEGLLHGRRRSEGVQPGTSVRTTRRRPTAPLRGTWRDRHLLAVPCAGT